MRIPLRPAVATFWAGAVVLVAAAAWGVTRVLVAGVLYDEGQEHLAAATALGAEGLRASREIPLDSVAGTLAVATGYRVSVFDADLIQIADSDLGPGHQDMVPDRGRRTEVVGGVAARKCLDPAAPAPLDDRDYLFSATRVYWEGAPVVIRFGAPSASIGDAASRVGPPGLRWLFLPWVSSHSCLRTAPWARLRGRWQM